MTREHKSELDLIMMETQTVLRPSKTCEISIEILDILLYFIPFA